MRLRFPVKLTPAEEGGFVVTFPDIPEAITQGDDRTEALENAAEALETALDFYFETHRAVPVPSELGEGQDWITLRPIAAQRVIQWNQNLQS